jgi:hypothetical protein
MTRACAWVPAAAITACLTAFGCKGGKSEGTKATAAAQAREADATVENLKKLIAAIAASDADLKPPSAKVKQAAGLEYLAVVDLALLKVMIDKGGKDKEADYEGAYDLFDDRTEPLTTGKFVKALRAKLRGTAHEFDDRDLANARYLGVVVADRLVPPVYAKDSYTAGIFNGRVYLLDLDEAKLVGSAACSYRSPSTLQYETTLDTTAEGVEHVRNGTVHLDFQRGVETAARVALGAKPPEPAGSAKP